MAVKSKARRVYVAQEVSIDSLRHDGMGVAEHDGKRWLVHGALPGERVMALPYTKSRGKLLATTEAVLSPSADRVTPPCEYAGYCGACVWQHASTSSQIARKQQLLADYLAEQNVSVGQWYPPIQGHGESYRQRARIGVKFVAKKGGCLVGFRELRSGRYIADTQSCQVLDRRLGQAIGDLRRCIESLSIPDRIPQVEWVSTTDQAALIIRHLDPLTDADQQTLLAWGESHGMAIWSQPHGLDSMTPLQGDDLFYEDHDAFNVRLHFKPQHFTQINHAMNQRMVKQAVDWLGCQSHHQVLDLFCGIGNFSLPFATRVAHVVGVEGQEDSVQMARANAQRNTLRNTTFYANDLLNPPLDAPWLQKSYDLICIDPPRSGSPALMHLLPKLNAQKILYVACEPRTLATDAAIVQSTGYRLTRAGVIDMFPHTRHVESMVLFEKDV